MVAFCNLIRRLVVDHLHVVGDIFDRGPYPNLIMDTLMSHHSVDIQWGNHDISWMGAGGQSGADLQRDPHLRKKIRQSESAGGWIWDQSGAACETGNEPL